MKKILKKIFTSGGDGFYRYIKIFGIKIKFPKYNRHDEIYIQTRLANLVCSTHSKLFPQYRNKYVDRDIVVFATGPSAKNYKPIENAIHIGVNHCIAFDKISFDYLFIMDHSNNNVKFMDDIDNYRRNECVKFYGIMPYGETANIPQNHVLAANAQQFYVTKERFNVDITCTELPDFGSITFSALSFALWTQPKRIYIVGCDCSSGYFDNKSEKKGIHPSYGWRDFKRFVDIHYPKVEIISVNPVGLKGMFNDLYQS